MNQWNILVVDDEEDMHLVTRLALRSRNWRGIPFVLSHARSAEEAKALLQGHDRPAIHVALIDVVMETPHAGLELCEFIRSNLPPSLRIILRTGQPGMAPEEKVLNDYDIDYYLPKSEATEFRLYSIIRACLRTCEDIAAFETTNLALTLKNAELARLSEFRRAVLSQLGDPNVGYISELLAHVDSLKNGPGLPADARRYVSALGDVARRITHIFRPYDFYSRADFVLQRKHILILVRNQAVAKWTRRALVGTSAFVSVANDIDEAKRVWEENLPDLVYVDWEHMGFLAEMKHLNREIMAVLLTTEPIFEANGKSIMDLPVASIVVTNALDTAETMDPLTTHEIAVTAGKLLSKDVFGLDKYLAWGTAIREERVVSSRERINVIERISNYASSCELNRRLRTQIETLADELMMNAIWDAPVDENGQAKYASRDRSIPLELEQGEVATVQYASDGNLFGISVVDHFGKLDRELAFRYLVKCFAKSSDQINQKEGGAGLGLYMAYLAVSTFVINVQPDQRTEVIGLLNMRLSVRDLRGRPRSFHYFRAKDGPDAAISGKK